MDVALLSETHRLKADIRRLADKFYHVIASSSTPYPYAVALTRRDTEGLKSVSEIVKLCFYRK